jgi:hypothetical protein
LGFSLGKGHAHFRIAASRQSWISWRKSRPKEFDVFVAVDRKLSLRLFRYPACAAEMQKKDRPLPDFSVPSKKYSPVQA